MKNTIKYNGINIDYFLKRTNIKSISIKVKEGEIYVSADLYSKTEFIEQFIIKNIEKILKQVEKTKINYKNGDKILIFGKSYNFYINYNSSREYIDLGAENLTINTYFENIEAKEYLHSFYQKKLMEYLEESFEKYTKKTGLFPKKVYIKKMTSRWGSCSAKGNISINLDLIKFDKEIIDYVVLHEICHLKEMNHSYRFWELMKKYMPDYNKRRYILKN